MAYQVLARKWRPQKFADVIGQPGVTQTLRNAIVQGRIAQAFVFAGPRGVGKTTTARILARALNCIDGPTEDPCGACDACQEIAEGRDIDVLEIDAATHTQVDNIREVVIAGLAIAPVRDRYKVFIIDEVHQLSTSSFNALLKSIEEPPAHVVFMMATTLLDKIPDTIRSRSQVFEFRTIGTAAISEQLRAIAVSEGVAIDETGLALIARSADGSMRDAESALDQVIAFAGESVSSAQVSTVLGLVGRDAVIGIAETIADEMAPRVFELTGQFVEAGYDLRSVCRELSRLVRDLLLLKVDAERITDPDVVGEDERERLKALMERFSREDLLRGFDVLSKAEFDIRSAAQPRYHFEVAMLRWMHLRKLVPLGELIEGLAGESSLTSHASPGQHVTKSMPAPVSKRRHSVSRESKKPGDSRVEMPIRSGSAETEEVPVVPSADRKLAFLDELKRTKKFFYGTVVAQAQAIEAEGDRVTFVFNDAQQMLSEQVASSRSWLEELAGKTFGKRIAIAVRKDLASTRTGSVDSSGTVAGEVAQPAEHVTSPKSPPTARGPMKSPTSPGRQEKVQGSPQDELLSEVLEDQAVQTILDVFPAEIKDIEEL